MLHTQQAKAIFSLALACVIMAEHCEFVVQVQGGDKKTLVLPRSASIAELKAHICAQFGLARVSALLPALATLPDLKKRGDDVLLRECNGLRWPTKTPYALRVIGCSKQQVVAVQQQAQRGQQVAAMMANERENQKRVAAQQQRLRDERSEAAKATLRVNIFLDTGNPNIGTGYRKRYQNPQDLLEQVATLNEPTLLHRFLRVTNSFHKDAPGHFAPDLVRAAQAAIRHDATHALRVLLEWPHWPRQDATALDRMMGTAAEYGALTVVQQILLCPPPHRLPAVEAMHQQLDATAGAGRAHWQQTSASLAVENGHLRMAKLLLHHGARVDEDALVEAVRRGMVRTAEWLLQEIKFTAGLRTPVVVADAAMLATGSTSTKYEALCSTLVWRAMSAETNRKETVQFVVRNLLPPNSHVGRVLDPYLALVVTDGRHDRNRYGHYWYTHGYGYGYGFGDENLAHVDAMTMDVVEMMLQG